MKILFFVFSIIFSIQVFALSPDSVYTLRPENWALMYRELDIKTKDSVNIKVWFVPAQEHQPVDTIRAYYKSPRKRVYILSDTIPKPTIVVCNGDAGNMVGLISFINGYVREGYNVVTFDWRGFGESGKFTIDKNYLCYTEFLIDYDAVVNAISSFAEVDNSKIGVFGFSTGAYLSFATAYKNPHVKCFVGRALMTSFDDFLPLLFEIYPNKKDVVKKPTNYPNDLHPINIAPNFNKPAMLIVGEKDKRTPIWMSKTIFGLLKGEKELWIVDNASHGGANGPEFIDFNLFIKKTVAFYDKYLKN